MTAASHGLFVAGHRGLYCGHPIAPRARYTEQTFDRKELSIA
jgi:hypothetical protein